MHLFGRKWFLPESPVTALLLQNLDNSYLLTGKGIFFLSFFNIQECWMAEPDDDDEEYDDTIIIFRESNGYPLSDCMGFNILFWH